MIKTNMCKLCGWKGRTQMHHIIPVRDMGENTDKNLIELCPNHHAEASEDEYAFAKENNLEGEDVSEEKLAELIEGSQLMMKVSYGDLTKEDTIRLVEISKKHGFDRLDYTAYMLGITRNVVERYVKDKHDLNIIEGEFM